MRSNDDGTFEADPGEQITFTVTRTNPPCVAGFAGDGWQSCGPVTQPAAAKEVKTCTAPGAVGARCTMSISVSFTPEPQGASDEYVVVIAGGNGGSAKDFFPPPPNINGEVYKFHVSQP
jgi:hypothetical protein